MKRTKLKRASIILILVSSISIGVWIIISSLNENIMFFYSPTELRTSSVTSKNIRVGGIVKPNSVEKIYRNQKHTTSFVLTDCIHNITVHHQGILPSLFREGQGIVAIGKLTNNEIFESKTLLAKHDENYSPKKPIDNKMEVSICNPKNFKK